MSEASTAIEGRNANIVFVRFGDNASTTACDDCPFRRCCTCAHWDCEARVCRACTALSQLMPATAADDWCGEWQPRPLKVAHATP